MDPKEPEPAQPSTSTLEEQDQALRQRLALYYQISSLKWDLKYCIFFHYLLSFTMLAKLAPNILNRARLFIPSIERLEVPQPYVWEWVWVCSILTSVFCFDAIKRNSTSIMRYYMFGICAIGFMPLFYGTMLWFPEAWVFMFSDDHFDRADLVYWKGYPLGMLWFVFIMLALHVHAFSLKLSWDLVSAWKARGTRRAE